MRTAPSASGGTSMFVSRSQRPNEKKGPTVCEGVVPVTSVLERCRAGAVDDDVELKAERPLRRRGLEVEPADHAPARLLVAHGLEDRVEREQRIAGEVHLRHQ